MSRIFKSILIISITIPVKHGLVKRASDWQYSSIHRYIKLNILDKNWGDGEVTFADDIGYE